MKHIVILGAGTGGALAANLLSHRLDLARWTITVIDRAHLHVYQPGLLFLPFRMYGYQAQDDVVRAIEAPLPPGVQFVPAEVHLIDHEARKIRTEQGDFPYDFLVCALGCRTAPEEIAGMAPNMGRDVHTFYTLEGALAMQAPLAAMTEGRLVVDICEMPIKCPVAPLEFAFLADWHFRQKGVRDRIEISLVTPYTGAFTKPNANRILSQVADEKGIKVVPNFATSAVDADRRQIRTYDGRTVEYDLLCAIPPNLGPAVIDGSGLGDGAGYALTDPRTLQSRKAERIYLLGDNTNVATSKAGSVAHFEAETVVENLLREIDGKPPLQTFDGHANCFVETGDHKAMLLDFNYDIEPLEGSFPLPLMGPFSLLEESHFNHLGKLAFKWVYWNMLLPGHLPNVPLLPAHMSFLGKDLTTSPQIRVARAMHVRDVMTRDVVTVHAGTSLPAAAELMVAKKVSGLPVLDAEDRVVGILTGADFMSAMNIEGGGIANPLETIVRKRRARKGMGTIVDDIMTRDPITIRAEDTLEHAVQRMDRNKVKRLVVTDGERRVRGVISRSDMIKLFAAK
ncbi:MAG: CBS domain-containing protein [Betaproteobacteria bacterium]|nr:CBS domain-containing protein [Betaproteobacteria bacterium]